MEINALKNRIFDDVVNLFTLCSSEIPFPEHHFYLVYHYVGSSRRYDGLCYVFESALDLARSLSKNNIDMQYHVVRLNTSVKYEFCVESFKH